MLGEAAFGVLREEQLVVDEDVELPLAARRDRRRVSVNLVDLGRETRGPGVVARSGRAVEDVRLLDHAVTLARDAGETKKDVRPANADADGHAGRARMS